MSKKLVFYFIVGIVLTASPFLAKASFHISTPEKIETNIECVLPNGTDVINGVVPGSELDIKVTLTREDNSQPMADMRVGWGHRRDDITRWVTTNSQGVAVIRFVFDHSNVVGAGFHAGDGTQGGTATSSCSVIVNLEDDVISQLNSYIRTLLGHEYVNGDIWHYYAERLTAAPNAPERIKTVDQLRNTMRYWLARQPNHPRGLTREEHAARQAQAQPSAPGDFISQLNQTAREVFGSTPTFTQWQYWATRIDRGEIVDVDDLRNKMTYHRNYFRLHGRFP